MSKPQNPDAVIQAPSFISLEEADGKRTEKFTFTEFALIALDRNPNGMKGSTAALLCESVAIKLAAVNGKGGMFTLTDAEYKILRQSTENMPWNPMINRQLAGFHRAMVDGAPVDDAPAFPENEEAPVDAKAQEAEE